MKEQKGITIASLLIYVVAMGLIISVIAIILSFYSKNISTINDTGDVNLELNKFTTKMIKETQEVGNQITEANNTTIRFKSGNTYTFYDNRIYQNTISLCNYVKEFSVNLEVEGSKQILKIYILLSKGQIEVVKNLSYVIILNNQEMTGLPTYVGSIIPSVDEKGLAKENTIITTEKENIQIVIPKGMAPAILEGSNWTTSEPGQSGRVKSIMPAEKWNNITAEDINKGIVIVDNSITYDGGNYIGTVPDFNEYVWVPILDSSKFARVAYIIDYTYDGLGNWIESGNTTIKTPLAEERTENYWWEDKTSSLYQNMITSVNRNKGFYVGRYEASNNGNSIPTTKRNQSNWADIGQNEAKEKCLNVNSTLHSHLMYAIEWDSILNWLQGNAIISASAEGQTKIMELEDIENNSNSWGNYYNAIGDATKEPYSPNQKQKTGASEYWKANNIYDLAGNSWETTQEQYSTSDTIAVRGGNYDDIGVHDPVASRYTFDKNANCAFRICLYL